MMPRIVIKATKFSRTPEADEVFDSRGWRPIFDNTIIPKKRSLVSRDRYGTPLINLDMEEWKYD